MAEFLIIDFFFEIYPIKENFIISTKLKKVINMKYTKIEKEKLEDSS